VSLPAGKKGFFSFEGVEKLGDREFALFSSLIYEKVGIYLKPEKKELLNARLSKRMRALGVRNFKDYYELVVADRSGSELVLLIDAVSTNFTSFFREKAHFDFLVEKVLPELSTRASEGVKLWSAACSSGEEPYTLAMVLEEYFRSRGSGSSGFNIQATDISTKVLATADKGVYPEERVRTVPPEMLKRYFQKGVGRSSGYVKVKDPLKQHVEFRRLNLMEDFPWKNGFEIIFCRNVMIYFDRDTQERLVKKFYDSLVPGGYLFIGHSESISRLDHGFKQVAATAYRK